MDLDLKGKLALVSGSTKGIGKAIAITLTREGARVIINGRSQASVDKAIAEIRAKVPKAQLEPFAGDLATAEATAALVAQFPQVEILVNNLGIFEMKSFEEITDADWQRFFDVNVLSGVRLARAYLPGMKARNWGRIIFISSESGIMQPTEMLHYGMTKSAQLAVSSGLAALCKGTAVTVNSVLPGPTHTEGVEDFVGQVFPGKPFAEAEGEFFAKARPGSTLQRFIKPSEIASMVAFIASPLSAATNGAAIRAEGGLVHSII